MTKKFFVSRIFFTKTNLLHILLKKPTSLIPFLQNSAQLLKITVFFPHQLFPLPISNWKTLNTWRIILKKIIYKLDPNKAHDLISVRMLKMSGDAIIEPLFKIFKNCLKCEIFPDDWKKGNIIPIFTKGDKQDIKSHRPVSLPPICSNIFQRIIYHNMLKYFLDINLISPKHSGFRPGDSFINHLLST